jgi:hypothetical protein
MEQRLKQTQLMMLDIMEAQEATAQKILQLTAYFSLLMENDGLLEQKNVSRIN